VPRTYPSKIVGYLTSIFHKRESLDQSTVQQYIGGVAGFLELYDQLPHELIRLPADDYAALVAAIGTVRYCADQFRLGKNSDCLIPVGRALARAWEMIEKLEDEVPSTTHDLSFISDPVLQEMIGLDIAAVSTALQSGEWKGATLLSGSCCEALLLYGLQTRPPGAVAAAVNAITWRSKAPDPADLTDRSWDLFSYTEVAHHLNLLSDTTKCELGPARDYRNLIHPAKSIREKVRCDQGTAYVGAGTLEHVISDLKKYL
jgi:hypothetical protein